MNGRQSMTPHEKGGVVRPTPLVPLLGRPVGLLLLRRRVDDGFVDVERVSRVVGRQSA